VALGQEAQVKVDAIFGEVFPGKVVEIASSGTKLGDVVKFKVKVALDQADPRLKPEMTAKVEIVTRKAENVVAVPLQAVQTRFLDEAGKEVFGKTTPREVQVVYLLQASKARMREVKTGVQDELYAEILAGLSGGEKVIVGPYKVLRTLKDGDQVQEAKAKRAKEEGDKGAH